MDLPIKYLYSYLKLDHFLKIWPSLVLKWFEFFILIIILLSTIYRKILLCNNLGKHFYNLIKKIIKQKVMKRQKRN